MFRCQDKGMKGEKVNDLSYRGKIFKMVRSHWKWAQINWTAMLIKKRYSLPYVQCPDIGRWMGQRSTSIDTIVGNDLWLLDYPSSWHCRCMSLYIFWLQTLVWLIWAQFHQNRMILKIWPLCKRSLTFILFSPLSWQRNIVWISCNWLFYSLWLEEEFEIYFNLIGVFLSFIPIYPLTLDFMVNMVFEKNARHVYLKVRTFLCILIYEFPNTNKMGTGLQRSLHYKVWMISNLFDWNVPKM